MQESYCKSHIGRVKQQEEEEEEKKCEYWLFYVEERWKKELQEEEERWRRREKKKDEEEEEERSKMKDETNQGGDASLIVTVSGTESTVKEPILACPEGFKLLEVYDAAIENFYIYWVHIEYNISSTFHPKKKSG